MRKLLWTSLKSWTLNIFILWILFMEFYYSLQPEFKVDFWDRINDNGPFKVNLEFSFVFSGLDLRFRTWDSLHISISALGSIHILWRQMFLGHFWPTYPNQILSDVSWPTYLHLYLTSDFEKFTSFVYHGPCFTLYVCKSQSNAISCNILMWPLYQGF